MESLDPKGLMGRGGQLLLQSSGVVINALIPSGVARIWKCSRNEFVEQRNCFQKRLSFVI